MRWSVYEQSRDAYFAERGGSDSDLDTYPFTPRRIGPFTEIEAVGVVVVLNTIAGRANQERERNRERSDVASRAHFERIQRNRTIPGDEIKHR